MVWWGGDRIPVLYMYYFAVYLAVQGGSNF